MQSSSSYPRLRFLDRISKSSERTFLTGGLTTLQLITGVVGIGVDGWLILLDSMLELGDVSMGEVILTQLIAAEVDRLDTPSVDGDPQLSVLMILVKEVGCIASVSFRCALLVLKCMAYWCGRLCVLKRSLRG